MTNVVQRLIEVVSALDEIRIPYLVMGGHAVRYYGFNRETTDYDLHIPVESGPHLADSLRQAPLFVTAPLIEAPTWRGEDFRRFVLGSLPDGKEELLEFWLRNHLLDDFADLHQRREEGLYGGRKISFLSLPDLIRSKETERESDWQDISFLEEILDRRNLSASEKSGDSASALHSLRSVRGLELATKAGLLTNEPEVESALKIATNPITQALLLPYGPKAEPDIPKSEELPDILRKHLKLVDPSSTRHLALVEAVRLRYKRGRQEIDRRDKDDRRKP